MFCHFLRAQQNDTRDWEIQLSRSSSSSPDIHSSHPENEKKFRDTISFEWTIRVVSPEIAFERKQEASKLKRLHRSAFTIPDHTIGDKE